MFRRPATPPAQLLLLLLTLAVTVALPGCSRQRLVIGLAPGDERITASVVQDDGRYFSDRVAIIDVSGRLINTDAVGLLGSTANPVSDFTEQLNAAATDPTVRAVILRLNTPGGGVTASDIMYRELLRFRQRTGKPVVALAMDVTASGGYYLACGADRLIAHPTSIVGSIGVVVQTFTAQPALANLGIRTEAITSGDNKDLGSPLGELTDEHRAILQNLVDDFYRRFTRVVRDARPAIPADRFDELTDGRVLSGADAADAGLIDATGDLHDAFAIAKRLADLPAADLILYHRPLEAAGSAYAQAPGANPAAASPAVGTQVNLAQFNLGSPLAGLDPAPRFYYLWPAP